MVLAAMLWTTWSGRISVPLQTMKALCWYTPQGTLLDGEPHWNAALPSEDNKK